MIEDHLSIFRHRYICNSEGNNNKCNNIEIIPLSVNNMYLILTRNKLYFYVYTANIFWRSNISV